MTQTTISPLTIVDSSEKITQSLIDQARAFFGHLPVAWGRYFTTGYPVEYSHSDENAFLHDNNIKLLPIARHTNHVGYTGAKGTDQGTRDAIQGVNDLFSTFELDYWKSQGNEFFFFLDVEGGAQGSLSKEYYEAWSTTLVSHSRSQSGNALTLLPCVYANYHDSNTFTVLKNDGLTCHGLWLARYHNSPQVSPAWDEHFAVPPEVQDSSIPVFLRQYAAGEQMKQAFDLDQTNPNIADIEASFLDKLILPPGAA